jgi:hypothetical protein
VWVGWQLKTGNEFAKLLKSKILLSFCLSQKHKIFFNSQNILKFLLSKNLLEYTKKLSKKLSENLSKKLRMVRP